MNKLVTFLKADTVKRRLLLKAFFWLCLLRVGLSLNASKTMTAVKRLKSKEKQSFSVAELCYHVSLMSAYVPKATCLVQALAAQVLLTKHGHTADLQIGVSQAKGFEAHAWLEFEGRVVLGGVTNLSDYVVLKAA